MRSVKTKSKNKNTTIPPKTLTSQFGAWTVHSRGLKARNVASNDWREFSSVICVTPYLDGGANVSEMYSPASGSSGLTLRMWDASVKRENLLPIPYEQIVALAMETSPCVRTSITVHVADA